MRAGLWFYCKRLRFTVQSHKGPVILACNHPNSFLDALIIGSHYKRPIHFLTRGDVFAKPVVARLLRGINMMPIHRLSEGKEGLKSNEQTFRKCLDVLQAGGTLLIFSEGICKNEWKLLPLKKGTSRLAYTAWHEQALTELAIKPVALSYSGFTRLPICVSVKEAASIHLDDVAAKEPGRFYTCFNALLQQRLESRICSPAEMANQNKVAASWGRSLLAVPAAIGWLAHIGLYSILKKFARRKTRGTVFYHSVLFGLLLIVYPVVLITVTSCVVLLTRQLYFWLLLLFLPFTAWCYKEYKGIIHQA